MESAVDLLKQSIDLAKEYDRREGKKINLLQSHAKALEEDIQFVLGFKEPNKILDKTVADALAEARRLRRDLDRQVLEFQNAQPPPVEPAPSSSSTVVEKVATAMLLPHAKLPTFNGDSSKFRLFYDTFVDTVQKNVNIAEMTKWIHLKNCLEGAALELIKELPETPGTLAVALKMLSDTYGSEERAVNELYNKLQRTEPAIMTTSSLRTTYVKIEGILMTLEQFGHDVNSDGYLRSVVLGKYPSDVIFTVLAGRKMPLKEIRNQLSQYIISRESTMEQILPSPTVDTNNEGRRSNTNRGAQSSRGRSNAPRTAGVQRTPRCIFCEEGHWSDECTKHTTLEERRRKVADRCQKCLRYAHPNINCYQERRCFHCDSLDHNRALCPKKFPEKSSTFTALVTENSRQNTVPTGKQTKIGEYWTLMVNVTTEKTKSVKRIRALIDPGSPCSMITKNLANYLQLKTSKKEKTAFVGINGTELEHGFAASDDIQLVTAKNKKIPMKTSVVQNIAQNLEASNVEKFKIDFPQYAHLPYSDPGKGVAVDLLIGGDNLLYLLNLDESLKVNEDYQLLATQFGYIIITARQKDSNSSPRHCFFTEPVEDVKLMYDLDLVGLRYIEKSEEKEEMEAIRNFYETIKFLDERYEVAWPWRYYPPLLDTNYGLALGRLKSLWKQLRSRPEILEAYHNIIQDQVKRGIAEKVQEKWPKDEPVHYLPHHPVVNMEKSTQVRPVYDASRSGVAKGSSLNQNMLKGTKWLTDLVGVLLRTREEKTLVTADIERAFHQISIRPADRNVVRFLWLKDPAKEPTSDNIEIYRFTRVAFGIISSPFLLNATINYHAEKNPNEYTQIIKTNLYADNLVTGLPSNVDPIHFYQTTKNFFASMGMNLTKWATNEKQLQSKIPKDDRQTDEIQSILGLKWNIEKDTLRLKKPNIHQNPTQKMTKRTILSQAASVYDPLGWATPLTLPAKIFIRKLWANGLSWDKHLQQQEEDEWKKILTELQKADQIELPRLMFDNEKISNADRIEIHAFVDASMEAYAVVIYALKESNSLIETTFVASKNRLAPKTKLTVPKLELLAALIGCRFAKFVIQSLKWETAKLFLWTDSKCVLAWIRSNRLLPPIVQRQVLEIKQHNIEAVNYVPTELNKADIATRGATYDQLKMQKWWNPPEWLQDTQKWPQQPEALVEAENISEQPVLFVGSKEKRALEQKSEDTAATPFNIKIKNYSRLSTLLRQTSCCARALNQLMKRNILQLDSKYDFRMAKLLWLRWDQQRVYVEAHNREKNTAFTLRNIRVFIDDNGIIRCLTRIEKAAVTEKTFCPILLVQGSHLTKLIILNKHELNFHTGTAHTLAATRKSYWLPQGRRNVYAVISNDCFRCKRQLTQTYPNPPPAPLPEFRVTMASKPFEATAIDICGPFAVRTMHGTASLKQKRWIIIFTCTRIRAVHLEVLTDMTTKEILDSIRRFVARRGTPHIIMSDNATQFHALNGIFQQLWPTITEDKTVVEYFAKTGIQWKFLPPESPWMGGVHERIVQMVKRCIERTYGDRTMADRQFSTVTVEIEGVINARPLTYVDKNMETPLLTPNNFLFAKFNAIPLNEVPQNATDPILNLWKSSEKYLDEFWRYWAQQYILELRDRDDKLKRKSRNAKDVPKKGELVILAESEKKRSSWTTAVIERLIPSNDGVIRSVQLRLPNRTRIIRPIVKLAPLSLSMELPNVSDEQLNADRTAIELPGPEGTVSGPQNAGGSSSSQSSDANGVSEAGEPSNSWSQSSGETVEIEIELSDWEEEEDSDKKRTMRPDNSPSVA